MSYIVLARKYRPQYFKDVIGQDHITQILEKSIMQDKIHHAYLFCGPRGVGKTSCARIMAKCLNCQDGPRLDPDENDPICQDINRGSSFDVLEIDGASNRGIDEVRALRENVKFAPSQGRYKIYIVDEVHMLTTEAFNALLKTLEEPPAHVKFIFATTEPNKLPATIISRCQRFDFKRVALTRVMELLNDICQQESVTISDDALFAIAKAGQGSLRDALSVLDQLSVMGDEGVKGEDVFAMLGMVETQLLFDLVDALAQRQCDAALEQLDAIIVAGKDIKQLNRDLIEHFRHLMIIKVGGKALGKLVDYPVHVKEMLLIQTQAFSLKAILNAIDMLIEVQETARITETLRMPMEVAFAKLTYDVAQDQQQPVVQPVSSTSPKTVAKPQNQKSTVKTSSSSATVSPGPQATLNDQSGKPDVSADHNQVTDIENDDSAQAYEAVVQTMAKPQTTVIADLQYQDILKRWDDLTTVVSHQRMSLAHYLQDGKPIAIEGHTIIIGFAEDAEFQKEVLEEMPNKKLVSSAFSEFLKMDVTVEYKITSDYTPQVEESSVQDALDTFQGEVINRWHNEKQT